MSGARWVLDASAMVALFEGRDGLYSMLQQADAGRARMFLPAVAVAEAEMMLRAGYDGVGAVVLRCRC